MPWGKLCKAIANSPTAPREHQERTEGGLGEGSRGCPPVPVILSLGHDTVAWTKESRQCSPDTEGERREQRGAEKKEAAIRLPLQMIKKVAPHAVNKQIGLRKAGVSPRQGLPLRRVPGTKGARVEHVPAHTYSSAAGKGGDSQHPQGDIKKDGGLSFHCLSRVTT